jgi:hypothetical protein
MYIFFIYVGRLNLEGISFQHLTFAPFTHLVKGILEIITGRQMMILSPLVIVSL